MPTYQETRSYFVRHFNKHSIIWHVFDMVRTCLFYYYYLIYYKLKIINPIYSLKEIYIEPVSYCNLRCPLCSLDHSKPKQRMSILTFTNIIEQIVNEPKLKNIETIHLHNGGEFFLHPEIKEMMTVLNTYKKIANTKRINFPKIIITTNATVFHAKTIEAIISLNVIDRIHFSIDGGNKEAFEQMRTPAKWENVEQNVLAFINLNKKLKSNIQTGIICVAEPSLSINNFSNEFKKLLYAVDYYEVRAPHNWAGDINIGQKKHIFKIGCGLLMHTLVIAANGYVTVCCADLNQKNIIGNVNDSRIIDLFLSKERIKMLRNFASGKKKYIPLCANCDSF